MMMVNFHNVIKDKYLSIAPNLWWGDDLDVRFFLLKNLIKIKNKKILDIGSNVGITMSFLDNSNDLHGIDIDSFCVSKARELNNTAHIIKGSMEYLPYADKSFDVIVMMNTIPHYDFPVSKGTKDGFIQRTFDEIYRVLRDDGVLYLTTPDGESIHFSNSKIKLYELTAVLSRFNYDLKGWNWFKPFYLFNNLKFYLNHPKIMCKFEFVWRRLVNDILCKNIIDVDKAKYFYLEARKIQ